MYGIFKFGMFRKSFKKELIIDVWFGYKEIIMGNGLFWY